MEGTSSQAGVDPRPQPRIGRSLLKTKKSEYRDVMANASRALRHYAAEFRKLKNLDNKKWKLMLKKKKDLVLLKLLEDQLASVLEKTRLLESLQ